MAEEGGGHGHGPAGVDAVVDKEDRAVEAAECLAEVRGEGEGGADGLDALGAVVLAAR